VVLAIELHAPDHVEPNVPFIARVMLVNRSHEARLVDRNRLVGPSLVSTRGLAPMAVEESFGLAPAELLLPPFALYGRERVIDAQPPGVIKLVATYGDEPAIVAELTVKVGEPYAVPVEPSDEVLQVHALEGLQRIDCSTSRCAANARGTGRLVRSPRLGDGWYLELYCPDCASAMHVRSGATDALVSALLGATSEERERIAAGWVRTRADHRKPWTLS